MIESDQTESIKQYWKKPGNKVALFTLLAVLTYTGIQAYQTHLISSNNVVSQRALIYVDWPNMVMGPDPKEPTKINVSFYIPLINSGNTATKNLQFFVRCAPSVEALPEPWVLLYRGTVQRVPQFIAPHQTARSLCTFSHSQLEDVKSGNLHAYLMGDVNYFDRLDSSTRHKAEFEWEVSNVNFVPAQMIPNTSSVMVPEQVTLFMTPVGQHNCADEECPPGEPD